MTPGVLLKEMITVRESRPEDAKGVAEVEASATATLRQVYRPNQKALSHKRSIARELVRLVAESEGMIVGTGRYYVDGDALRIIGLGVLAGSRRQGVASAIVASVAERARERGHTSVVTRTVEETGNVPIFQALGFVVESRCPDEYSESVIGGALTDVSLRMEITNGSRTTPRTVP